MAKQPFNLAQQELNMSNTTNSNMTNMQKFKRLEEIKNALSSQAPDLDSLVPLYDEAMLLEGELKVHINNIKSTIAKKRKEREQEVSQ
jgi:exonuclease VII small subunit